MKKNTIILVAGLVTVGLVGWHQYKVNKEAERLEQRRNEFIKNVVLDEVDKQVENKIVSDFYFQLNEEDLMQFIPHMTGWTEPGTGAFTVYKEVLPENVRFPRSKGQLLYIPSSKLIPNGGVVEITDILGNDTVVMYRFKMSDPVEALENMTSRMDSLLMNLKNGWK